MIDVTVKPIRICFIILKAYPLFNPDVKAVFGGAEVDLYFLATELAKDKHFKVSFIVGDYGQKSVEEHENVTVIKSVDVTKNLFLGSWRIWQALRRADAHIYISKAYSLGTFLYAFFCKVNNRKYVYRTASAEECDGMYIKQHFFRSKAIIWAVRSAQKVLVQNYTDAENLLKTANIHSEVIRNGHRLNLLSPTQRDTILWVGRSAAIKRPSLFVELARQMPDQHFTMVCQRAAGDDSYENIVEQAGKADNMQFVQRVPFHDIDSYFQRAKVFVNTSDLEGFPNTFIQACKCATPILSLNVNPDGFLDKYNCGISCEGDWKKFVDSLKVMLAEWRYTKLGKNARKYVEENHDVTKIVGQYKTIFVKLDKSCR